LAWASIKKTGASGHTIASIVPMPPSVPVESGAS
jgi:hypothetical protein